MATDVTPNGNRCHPKPEAVRASTSAYAVNESGSFPSLIPGCTQAALPSCRFGSKSWRLLPEVHRSKLDTFITSKQTYDAFHNTELQEVLEAHGVGQLVISGVMTNCCCETTARHVGRLPHTWCTLHACGRMRELLKLCSLGYLIRYVAPEVCTSNVGTQHVWCKLDCPSIYVKHLLCGLLLYHSFCWQVKQ